MTVRYPAVTGASKRRKPGDATESPRFASPTTLRFDTGQEIRYRFSVSVG